MAVPWACLETVFLLRRRNWTRIVVPHVTMMPKHSLVICIPSLDPIQKDPGCQRLIAFSIVGFTIRWPFEPPSASTNVAIPAVGKGPAPVFIETGSQVGLTERRATL